MGIQIQVPLTSGLTTPRSHEQLVGTNCILGTIISQLSCETKNSVRCMSLTQCVAVTNEARAPEYNPVSSRPKLSPMGHEFSISSFSAKQELQQAPLCCSSHSQPCPDHFHDAVSERLNCLTSKAGATKCLLPRLPETTSPGPGHSRPSGVSAPLLLLLPSPFWWPWRRWCHPPAGPFSMGSKHRGPFQPPLNITHLSAPHPQAWSHGEVRSSPSKSERANARDNKSPCEFFTGAGTPHPIAPCFLMGSI